MDMSVTIIPKSDQLNADDLISGDRTITITKIVGSDDPQQPVAIFYEGSNKPYKPCKSMRRVMVKAWGADAKQYIGRSLRIYCDPDVTFGGMKVGGIRISHMSHIESGFSMALTASKTKRSIYAVKKLEATSPSQLPGRNVTEAIQYFSGAPNMSELGIRWKEIATDWALYNADEQSQLMKAKDERKATLNKPVSVIDDEFDIQLED